MFKTFLPIFLALVLLGTTSCGRLKSANLAVESIDQRISPEYSGPPEKPYCGGSVVFSPGVTISGKAEYEYRTISYTSEFRGLGEVAETNKPIRFAEVVIIDSEDNIIQCGETDIDGNYTLSMPADSGLYRIRVHSRSNNPAQVRASVLRSPESNFIYYLEKVFTTNQNHTLNFVAKATGTLEGGAFHILDEILSYNIKLRELVSTCSGSYTGCTAFTTAPKVAVYWEKGFNPGSYLNGSPQSSFYYKGTNRLFILGGVDGDVDYSDTDHFDKSIIAHEYFHFLENTLGDTDSPGGSHNGNQLIDPRLAWSEGAAQFFQGVMTGIPRVLDSRGNSSGSSNLIVDYSIEIVETDEPREENEGEFREFSVARVLWDAYDDTPGETFATTTACSASDISGVNDKCAKNGFPHFWAAFTGNNGFKHSNNAFISISRLHHLHKRNFPSPTAAQNWIPLRTFDLQAHDRVPALASGGNPAERVPFGTRLVACGTARTFTMNPPYYFTTSPTWRNSHLVTNNNFLHFTHPGGAMEISLVATPTPVSSSVPNLNLIIYREDFFIGNSNDIVFHQTTPNIGYTGSPPVPTHYTYLVSAADVPAGNYMINVNLVSISGSGAINYTLTSTGAGGSPLCPEAQP